MTKLREDLQALTEEIDSQHQSMAAVGTGSQTLVPQMLSIPEQIFAKAQAEQQEFFQVQHHQAIADLSLWGKFCHSYTNDDTGSLKDFTCKSALVALYVCSVAEVLTVLWGLYIAGSIAALLCMAEFFAYILSVAVITWIREIKNYRQTAELFTAMAIAQTESFKHKFWSDPIFQIQQVTAFLRKVHEEFATKLKGLESRYEDTVKKPRQEWDRQRKLYREDELALRQRTREEVPERDAYIVAVFNRIRECESFLAKTHSEAEALDVQLIWAKGRLAEFEQRINDYEARKSRYLETDALVARVRGYGDTSVNDDVIERERQRKLLELRTALTEFDCEVAGMDQALTDVTQKLPEPETYRLPSFLQLALPV